MYVLSGSLDGEALPSWPCQSEFAAFQKAGEYFDHFGARAKLQIKLNDDVFYSERWMAKWNSFVRPASRSAAEPLQDK